MANSKTRFHFGSDLPIGKSEPFEGGFSSGDRALCGSLGSRISQEFEDKMTGLNDQVSQGEPISRTDKSSGNGRFSVKKGHSWSEVIGGGGWRITPSRQVDSTAREINWSDPEGNRDSQDKELKWKGWGQSIGWRKREVPGRKGAVQAITVE